MKILITLTVLLAALLTVTFQSTQYDNKELKVVLRYDDYSKYSSLELEKELFNMVHSKGGGLLIGVIPYPYEPHPAAGENFTKKVFLNTEKRDLLKQYHQNKTIEVAVHGFNHKDYGLFAHKKSEFAGLPALEQEQLLKITRSELEDALGFKVTAFVPPFNKLDRNTLTALKNNGFTLLSAASSNSLYQPGDIDYLPGGPYPNKLRAVLNTAVSKNHYDALIISTQHPYDIKESGEKMPSFRKNKKQVSLADIESDLKHIDKLENVQLTSLSKLREHKENLSAERLIANMQLSNSFVSKHRLLPDPLELYPVAGLYYSLQAANDMYIKQIIIADSLYLLILLIVLIIIRYILSFFSSSIWLPRGIALTAFIFTGIALVKIYFGGFYFLAAAIATISISLILSISVPRNTKDSGFN